MLGIWMWAHTTHEMLLLRAHAPCVWRNSRCALGLMAVVKELQEIMG